MEHVLWLTWCGAPLVHGGPLGGLRRHCRVLSGSPMEVVSTLLWLPCARFCHWFRTLILGRAQNYDVVLLVLVQPRYGLRYSGLLCLLLIPAYLVEERQMTPWPSQNLDPKSQSQF